MNNNSKYQRERQRRFFISHPTKFDWFIPYVEERINELGYGTFVDHKHLKVGDIQQRLTEELQASSDFLVFLNPDSLKSPWIAYELSVAVAWRKNLVPVIDELTQQEIVEHFPFLNSNLRMLTLSELAGFLKP